MLSPTGTSVSLGSSSRVSRATQAFTLVEVVLALGVVSFAFLALLGLVPVGLDSYQRAAQLSATSQIAQRVFSDVRQASFSDLVTATSLPDRYFDEQGNEVTRGGAYVYQVQTQIESQTHLPNESSATANLATVRVAVASNPGRASDPFAVGAGLQITRYSTLVAGRP